MIATSSVSIIDVNDGTGISSSIVEYCISTSGTIPPGNPLTDGSGHPIVSNNGLVLTDGSWSSTLPEVPEGQYLWTRTRLIMSDGTFDMIYTVSRAGEDGAVGPQGVSVTKVVTEYRLSNSSTELTGSGTGYTWSETKPEIPSGKYLWERERTDLSNNTSTYGTAHCDIVISGLVFDVDRNSNAITQKVWESDITTSINSYDGSTGQAIRDRVTQTESDISGITSRVSDVESETDDLGTRMTSAESSITQNANNIALKVSSDGVISAINQSAEAILISASKVNIQGAVSFSSFDQTLQNRITGVESTASTANTNASTALKGIKVYSGTCSTATGTAAKVVSCSDTDFALTNGVVIKVTFSTASTADAPTLNVNSLGAKPIYFDSAAVSSSNRFRWQAGSTIIFQYDGTNWVVINYQNLDYFVCSTAAGTTAKETNSVTGTFVLCKGTTITVFFGTSNTANAPTLNVGATGAYAIYYKNEVTSSSNSYKWDANTTVSFTYNGSYWYVNDGGSQLVKDYAKTAVDWVGTNGSTVVTAADIMKTWVDDATLATTTIDGGYIKTHTIESTHLATDAIMSSNYQASSNASSPYSATGAFLDLSTGNLYMPNFGVNGTTGAAYFNGTVNANAGKFGDDTSYWNIETVYDYNMQPHAALVGTGSPYLQTGNWQVSDNAVATRKYTSTSESSGNATYYKDSGTNTFYDVGMKIPSNFGGYSASDSSVTRYNKAFYYGRKYTGNNAPSLDSDWTYFFSIDSGGNVITAGDVYEGGVKLSEKYAAITDVGSAYLPKTGGTITGNLSVNGSFTTNLMLQTNLGSTSSAQLTGAANAVVKPGVTGTLGVGNGGTGATSFTSGAVLIGNGGNAIQTRAIRNNTTQGALGWTSSSADNTIITTNTLAYWDGRYQTANNASNIQYVKLGKLGTVVTHNIEEFITTSGGVIDGSLSVVDLSAGNLIVTGAGRFTNGLYGDLIGNADTATTATTADKVGSNLVILLNSGTTEGTNKFTYNGSAAKNVNITKSSIGLGNVDNTADANKTVKEAGKVTNTLKIQLNGGTTEGTNQFSYNGSAVKNINITKSSVGLGNVENTALSTWAGSANLTTTKVGTLAAAAAKGVDTSISASSTSANLPTSAAVATFVEGKGYVTSSGVTSITLKAGTGVSLDTNNTAITSTGTRTISLANTYGDTKNPYGTKTKNYVLAGPTTGSAAAPTFRALVADDIPTLTPGKAGLGNVTNNKQVKGLSSGTTSGHLVSWGADGYTVADSGVAVSSVNKTVKSLASNNDGKIVLTYLDGTTSDPIEVKIIGSSGSSVSYADALNVNGKAVGGAEQPVFINNQGKPQTANKIPKLNNGTTGGTFYAPTGAGTSGQVLTSSGGTPSWTNQASLSVGTAANVSASAGTANVARHVWFSDNTAETKRAYDDNFQYNPSTNTLTVANVSGNASSATKLTTSAGDWSVPVYFSNGKPVETTYLNLHPENANSMIIPFFNNDWAYLIERGGAYEIYSTTATSFTSTSINKTAISVDLTNAFDASYTYIGVNRPQTETTVIDITCPATHTYTNTFYIDFGSSSWRANSIQILAYNTATESEYVSKGSITNNTLGHWKLKFSHSSTNTNGTTVQGFNRVRIVLSGWANTQNRIAQIGLVNYSSQGQRITYMSRGIDDPVYRSITPAKNNHYNLGSSSYKWANVYATTFSGNATSATKATQDGNGAVISSTYAKLSGATFTGAINTANNTWNTIGDDAYLGDINKGGHIGIKGKNGNTGLFFVTYNQNSNTTGGAITWDGTKFSISGTVDTSISGNATTATTATTANSIKNLGRKANLDIDNTDNQYKNKVTYMLASSSTTTGKPPTDSGVLNFAWDGNRWGAQLAISINTTPHLYLRGNNNSDWDASWLTVLDSNNFNTYAPKKDGTGATGTWGISISGSATKATQDSDGHAINTTYMKKSGGAFTGAVTGTSFAASSYIAVNSGNSGTAGGLALWSTDPTAYGIMLRTTANQGKHGYVQGEYAAYLTMSGATASSAETRGWVFKNKMANACVTSISALGHAVFNGSVTVGGNATNTSGCRQEFDADLQCLNFIFN